MEQALQQQTFKLERTEAEVDDARASLTDVLQRSREEQTRMANLQRSGAMRLRQRAQVDEQYLSDQDELKRLRRQTQEQQEQLQALVDLQQRQFELVQGAVEEVVRVDELLNRPRPQHAAAVYTAPGFAPPVLSGGVKSGLVAMPGGAAP